MDIDCHIALCVLDQPLETTGIPSCRILYWHQSSNQKKMVPLNLCTTYVLLNRLIPVLLVRTAHPMKSIFIQLAQAVTDPLSRLPFLNPDGMAILGPPCCFRVVDS